MECKNIRKCDFKSLKKKFTLPQFILEIRRKRLEIVTLNTKLMTINSQISEFLTKPARVFVFCDFIKIVSMS